MMPHFGTILPRVMFNYQLQPDVKFKRMGVNEIALHIILQAQVSHFPSLSLFGSAWRTYLMRQADPVLPMYSL